MLAGTTWTRQDRGELSMSNTARETFDAYAQALLSGGDITRFLAPDVRWTTMETGEEVRGPESVRDLIAYIHSSAFDASVELVRVVSDEHGVVIEAVFDGVQTGEFLGRPPTGARVRVPYTMSYDIADGRITALRAYFPLAAVRDQLAGAVPAQTAPA